jgi:hypothetical protein
MSSQNNEYQAIASYEFDDVGRGKAGGIKMVIDARGKANAEHIPGGEKYTFTLTQEELTAIKNTLIEKHFFDEKNVTVEGVDDTGPIIISVKDQDGRVLKTVTQDSYALSANFRSVYDTFYGVFKQKIKQSNY